MKRIESIFVRTSFVFAFGFWVVGCKKGPTPQAPSPLSATTSKPELKEVVNWNEFTGRTAAVKLVMTSFAFILGVLPLVIAQGAGAEMNQALGTAVFAGMLGVTFFGIFFTPVFFSLIMSIFGRVPKKRRQRAIEHQVQKEEPVH